MNRVRYDNVRSEEKARVRFFGLGRVNPRVEAHDKKDQISKKNLVLDGILHDFSGVNCPCPLLNAWIRRKFLKNAQATLL